MTSRDYLFVVDGELSDGVALAFEGMRLHRDEGTTTIEGPCRDQAELMGTLLRISDLGLTLLSCASKDSGGSPTDDALTPRTSAVASSRGAARGQQT